MWLGCVKLVVALCPSGEATRVTKDPVFGVCQLGCDLVSIRGSGVITPSDSAKQRVVCVNLVVTLCPSGEAALPDEIPKGKSEPEPV